MNTPFSRPFRVPPPTPSGPTIDRQIATDLVSLLREDGLIRGKAVLRERAKVVVTLEVEAGTEPSKFCEAMKSAHPDLAEKMITIMQPLLVKDQRGQLVLQFPFSLRLAAIQLRSFANTGSLFLKLI